MSGSFVEYVLGPEDRGHTDRPLAIMRPGKHRLDFLPKEEYGGRRIEPFDTEEEALTFVKHRPRIFRIATDVVDAVQRQALREIVVEAISPFLAGIEDLKARVANLEVEIEAKANKGGPKKKIALEASEAA